MTNKLVVIINSLKVPKINKILLYEMKFFVPNYRCLQNSWLGGYCPQIPVLSVLCPELNLLNPPEQNSWVRHSQEPVAQWHGCHIAAELNLSKRRRVKRKISNCWTRFTLTLHEISWDPRQKKNSANQMWVVPTPNIDKYYIYSLHTDGTLT